MFISSQFIRHLKFDFIMILWPILHVYSQCECFLQDMCYNLSATEFRDFCPCNCYFWRTGKGFSQLPVVAAENENDLQNASIIAAEVRAREAPKPVALAPFVGSTTAPWTGEYTNMAVEILYPICPMSHLFKTFCASHKTFELNMFCMF